MKNFMKTAALGLTLATASTAVFADAHADPAMLTCAEFGALEIADQDAMLKELIFNAEGVSVDDEMMNGLVAGDVAVLCNGFDDETVASILEKLDN